jgi:DNA helicase-2/ATP-dependent DNA helicase PcrA
MGQSSHNTLPAQPAGSRVAALDDSQKKFCLMDGGAVRLLAPAGSGKTLSLLWRCRALAERSDKTKPRFLVFTFTRAARDELRDRLKTNPAFKDVAPLVTITTLNAWGFRQVKSVTTNLKLIVSSRDQYFCVQNILQPIWRKYPPIKALLEDNRRKNRAGRDLLHLIDFLKSMGLRHDKMTSERNFQDDVEYLVQCGMSAQVDGFAKLLTDLDIIESGKDTVAQIFKCFMPFWRETCEILFNSAVITLEDQKYWARIALERQVSESRFTTGSARYHHIMVDEFQDINPLDLALLKVIARANKAELTIAGDDDQAIYEWRGATPEFILEPDKHLGGKYQTVILNTNYRSPRNIVQLSQRLIVHNKRRVPKEVRAAQTEEAHVRIRRFPSISESINNILVLVQGLLKDDQCKSVALIGRKRSQIIPYQIVFASHNIPFYAAEDLHVLLSDAFGELKEILAIRARSAMGGIFGTNPIEDLLKLCDKVKRYPLANKDREALKRYLYQAHPASLKAAVDALRQYSGPLKGANDGGRISDAFAAAISQFMATKTVSQSIHAISNEFEGLQKDYGRGLEDIFYTDPPFLYLAEFADRYGEDYARFYQDIELAVATLARVSPDDDAEEDKNPEWKLPLHLMTALRAKGKEFDAVIILDANDGIWPSKLAKTDAEKEQERRLFYVAVTRARRYLYLSLNDIILGDACSPSPFLREMGLKVPANAK